MSTRLKVRFVSVLSCLALMLALFASTGIASAYSVQAVHSQVSTSTSGSASANDRCRDFGDCGFRRFNRFHRGFNCFNDFGGGCFFHRFNRFNRFHGDFGDGGF